MNYFKLSIRAKQFRGDMALTDDRLRLPAGDALGPRSAEPSGLRCSFHAP